MSRRHLIVDGALALLIVAALAAYLLKPAAHTAAHATHTAKQVQSTARTVQETARTVRQINATLNPDSPAARQATMSRGRFCHRMYRHGPDSLIKPAGHGRVVVHFPEGDRTFSTHASIRHSAWMAVSDYCP